VQRHKIAGGAWCGEGVITPQEQERQEPLRNGYAMKAIPTEYRGARFRSRLEARWAAFFDLIGWRWVYEPFDLDGWTPDFLIKGEAPLLVEVGPCSNRAEYESKSVKATGHGRAALVLGVGPDFEEQHADGSPDGFTVASAGWLVGEGSTGGHAFWYLCKRHSIPVIYQDAWYHYPCGCGWSEETMSEWDLANRFEHWNRAGSAVQWKKPAA